MSMRARVHTHTHTHTHSLTHTHGKTAPADVDFNELQDKKLLQRMRVLEDKGLAFGLRRLRDLKYMGA